MQVGNTLRSTGDPFNAAPVTMLLIGANAAAFLQRLRVRQCAPPPATFKCERNRDPSRTTTPTGGLSL